MEKYLNTKKTKYERVAEILDKDGYLSDTKACKIWGNEEGVYKCLEHIRIWKKLQSDREYFKNVKIIEKKKGHRCHLIKIEGLGENSYYKVGKEFYKECIVSEK